MDQCDILPNVQGVLISLDYIMTHRGGVNATLGQNCKCILLSVSGNCKLLVRLFFLLVPLYIEKIMFTKSMYTCYVQKTLLTYSEKDTIPGKVAAVGAIAWLSLQWSIFTRI